MESPKFNFTVLFLEFVFGLILLNSEAFGREPKNSYLKKVFIIIRHGDRNPVSTYKNDPHANYSWPGGFGALTKNGMRQMYELGEWMQEKYGELTNNKYVAKSTVVNSSVTARCVESTQAFLAGFFKQNDQEAFIKGLPWRPIFIQTLPKNIDSILTDLPVCLKVKLVLAKTYREFDAQHLFYYQELSCITGEKIQTIGDLQYVYDTIESQTRYGLKIQEEVKPQFDKMRELNMQGQLLFSSSHLLRRLYGGLLLKDVLYHMSNQKGEEKIFIYGTHDRNIMSFLRAMGFTKKDNSFYRIGFGAALVFELLSIHDNQEVRVSMLQDGNSRSPINLKIPGCEKSCKLNDLYAIWENVFPVDWEKECMTFS